MIELSLEPEAVEVYGEDRDAAVAHFVSRETIRWIGEATEEHEPGDVFTVVLRWPPRPHPASSRESRIRVSTSPVASSFEGVDETAGLLGHGPEYAGCTPRRSQRPCRPRPSTNVAGCDSRSCK